MNISNINDCIANSLEDKDCIVIRIPDNRFNHDTIFDALNNALTAKISRFPDTIINRDYITDALVSDIIKGCDYVKDNSQLGFLVFPTEYGLLRIALISIYYIIFWDFTE